MGISQSILYDKPSYLITGNVSIPENDMNYEWKMIEYNQQNQYSRIALGYDLIMGWQITGRYVYYSSNYTPDLSKIVMKKIKQNPII